MAKIEKVPQPVLKVLQIPHLVTLSTFQMRRDRRGRVRVDEGKVREYATAYEAGRALPPIRVAVVKGTPFVVDGWHRLAALERIGASDVEAEVFDGVTKSDALAMAATANLEHGLPLKPAEVRNVFCALIRARRHINGKRYRSYRELAAMLANRVRHTTVRYWMLKDFPKVAAKMGAAEPTGDPDADVRGVDVQEALERDATRSLKDALAVARGVKEKKRRGRIIATMEETLLALKAGGEWVMPDENPDF